MMNLVTPYNCSTIELYSMPFLALGDFSGMPYAAVREDIIRNYEIDGYNLDKFRLLIAFNEGHSENEESAHFLMVELATNTLCEVYASHCSCFGYEGQFVPETTTLEYLLSDKSGFFHSNEEARKWIALNIAGVVDFCI
jgi:hypothetical protein